MNAITICSGATGLNTVVDPIRLSYDPETGISDLAVAVNIKIDETGYISRRDGYEKITDLTDGHSLFCDGGICLIGAGTELYRVHEDLSIELIHTLQSNNKISFCQVNDDIYYTNKVDLGVVNKDGVRESWEKDSDYGPDSNRSFDEPRPGSHLAFFYGRMLMSDGPVLWWSEPYHLGSYDRARSFVTFASDIIMIKPVVAGVFISDKKFTYFLRGTDPSKFTLEKVANYPALEWSDAIDYVEGLDIGLQNPGLCALWSSLEGACLGSFDGMLINLNRKKVIYPERGTWGTSLLRGYNFIHSIGV